MTVSEQAGERNTALVPGIDGTETTRDRIVRAAAELFAENGYDATGIADLQAKAEISRGAFYYHVDSKQTLLFEICKSQVDKMNRVAAEIAAGDALADRKIGDMARALLRNIGDHRAEWAVFFREFLALTGERRTEILLARDRYEQYWMDLFRAGTDEGLLTTVTPLQVKGILGMLNYTYLWLDPHGSMSPEELADSFVSIFMDGLRLVRQDRRT